MTDRADKLRRLAERVERGDWSGTNRTAIAYQIAESLHGDRWYVSEAECILEALKGSVDAARRLMGDKRNTTLTNTLVPDQWDAFWTNIHAAAQEEAHARLALALRVWAEMEEG